MGRMVVIPFGLRGLRWSPMLPLSQNSVTEPDQEYHVSGPDLPPEHHDCDPAQARHPDAAGPWLGFGSNWAELLVVAGMLLVAALLSLRLFRWE
jgi:hypothetical protein